MPHSGRYRTSMGCTEPAMSAAQPGRASVFAITRQSGVHLKFANGWTASVQWGGGNYCDNYNSEFGKPAAPSKTAEVAFWPSGGEMQVVPDQFGGQGNTVAGYLDADSVVAFLLHVAAQEKC